MDNRILIKLNTHVNKANIVLKVPTRVWISQRKEDPHLNIRQKLSLGLNLQYLTKIKNR